MCLGLRLRVRRFQASVSCARMCGMRGFDTAYNSVMWGEKAWTCVEHISVKRLTGALAVPSPAVVFAVVFVGGRGRLVCACVCMCVCVHVCVCMCVYV